MFIIQKEGASHANEVRLAPKLRKQGRTTWRKLSDPLSLAL